MVNGAFPFGVSLWVLYPTKWKRVTDLSVHRMEFGCPWLREMCCQNYNEAVTLKIKVLHAFIWVHHLDKLQ